MEKESIEHLLNGIRLAPINERGCLEIACVKPTFWLKLEKKKRKFLTCGLYGPKKKELTVGLVLRPLRKKELDKRNELKKVSQKFRHFESSKKEDDR